MFNDNDLDAMTARAKEQLEEQVGQSDDGGDLYAEFREDGEDVPVSEDYDSSEFNILNKPTKKEENPNIEGEPDEEFYQQDAPELSPYDELLFPDGPSMTQVESWKKQWDGYDVFITEILEEYFVFRTLNRFEYKQLVSLKNVDPIQREEVICETVTLWPSEYKWDVMATGKAGIPSTYAQIVMEKSGFTKEYAIQVL